MFTNAGIPRPCVKSAKQSACAPPPPSNATSTIFEMPATSSVTWPSPRAIQVNYEGSGSAVEHRPVRHVPLVGDVAAGTDVLAESNVEEFIPMPEDLTGSGELFMLRVRGDSMIEAGIFDGDFVVCRRQDTADDNKIVVAGIPGDEATVKTLRRRAGSVALVPANPQFSEMVFNPEEVQIFGQVVTVMRKL